MSTSVTHVDADAEALAEASDGFFLAAEHGRSDVLRALADHASGKLELRRIVDPTTGRSPLHVAVANGKTDAVRVLLAAGFPPDHESFPAAVASAAVANGGSDTTTNSSSSSSAGEDKPSDDPERRCTNTPYLLAKHLHASDLVFVFHQFAIQQVATNSVTGVQQMLRAGVDVATTDGAARNTFVHWAVTCAARDVLALLLQRTDVQRDRVMDRTNAEGATPLHLACRANDVESTRLLLRYSADRTVVGDCGAFRGKTAQALATAPEVIALFATAPIASAMAELAIDDQQSVSPLSDVSNSAAADAERPQPPSLSSGSVAADSTLLSSSAAGVSGSSRRPSLRAETDATSARLLLQLEEKDLLIAQLRRTIESLVVEAQEIRKLGDERVVLDYVRKLREENAVLQRDLDDAEEHIRIQQEQLAELKTEMRKLVIAPGTARHANTDLLENDASVASAAAQQSASDAPWGNVLGGLWPFSATDEVQDMDGEVTMTV